MPHKGPEILQGICLNPLFVELACGERGIVVTIQFSVCACECVFMHALMGVCLCPSKFVWTITSTIVDGFQNNLTQLFSITCRCAI